MDLAELAYLFWLLASPDVCMSEVRQHNVRPAPLLLSVEIRGRENGQVIDCRPDAPVLDALRQIAGDFLPWRVVGVLKFLHGGSRWKEPVLEGDGVPLEDGTLTMRHDGELQRTVLACV